MPADRDMPLEEWLGATSLFAGVESTHLRDLSGIAMVASYKPRVNIFSSGDPGAGFYLVMEGRVKGGVVKPLFDGSDAFVVGVGCGDGACHTQLLRLGDFFKCKEIKTCDT